MMVTAADQLCTLAGVAQLVEIILVEQSPFKRWVVWFKSNHPHYAPLG